MLFWLVSWSARNAILGDLVSYTRDVILGEMTCHRCDSCLVIWLTRDEIRVNRVGEMDNQRCVRHICGSCLFGSGNETFPCNIL